MFHAEPSHQAPGSSLARCPGARINHKRRVPKLPIWAQGHSRLSAAIGIFLHLGHYYMHLKPWQPKVSRLSLTEVVADCSVRKKRAMVRDGRFRSRGTKALRVNISTPLLGSHASSVLRGSSLRGVHQCTSGGGPRNDQFHLTLT